MDPILQINLFSFPEKRLKFCFKNLDQLLKSPSEKLKRVKLAVFATKNLETQWEQKLATMGALADVDLWIDDKGEYGPRTMQAIQNTCKLSMRLDDDEFLGPHLWEFIIDNLELLNDPQVAFLSPILTTSTFSVEFFVDDFLSTEDAVAIRKIFKKDGVPRHPWGPPDYESLQKLIANFPVWDQTAFFDKVNSLPTPFRGIHPIRFSDEANLFLCERIIANFSKILATGDYRLHKVIGKHDTHPFIFRTELWREAMKTPYDYFDELPLNFYARNNGLSTYYIRNGYAIHMAHGYVPSQSKIEEIYSTIEIP
jgi:hypothetical protein